jgi:hypothetical protein
LILRKSSREGKWLVVLLVVDLDETSSVRAELVLKLKLLAGRKGLDRVAGTDFLLRLREERICKMWLGMSSFAT